MDFLCAGSVPDTSAGKQVLDFLCGIAAIQVRVVSTEGTCVFVVGNLNPHGNPAC